VTYIGSHSIPSCISHRPLSTHQITLKLEKNFLDERMDVHAGRMDVRTYLAIDRRTFPILMLLRQLGGVDLIMSVTIFPLVI